MSETKGVKGVTTELSWGLYLGSGKKGGFHVIKGEVKDFSVEPQIGSLWHGLDQCFLPKIIMAEPIWLCWFSHSFPSPTTPTAASFHLGIIDG